MKTRDINLKIPDIKYVRVLTRFLGKLGLDTCRTWNPPPPHPWQNSPNHQPWMYGLGLKESKDYVESKYQYIRIPGTPLGHLQTDNEIHIIKRVRQTMNMLNKLGLKTPDAGLRPCKDFVVRMRR